MSEQLIELMLQLKKTTPTAAKQILNSQPQIAYALMALMVSMNAVNYQVFQKTLSDFSQTVPQPQTQTQAPPSSSYQRPNPTPPQTYPYGTLSQPSPAPGVNPAVLAAIPDDQKAIVMQVLSITPEQLAMLPPQDRANIMQLKATFGL